MLKPIAKIEFLLLFRRTYLCVGLANDAYENYRVPNIDHHRILTLTEFERKVEYNLRDDFPNSNFSTNDCRPRNAPPECFC